MFDDSLIFPGICFKILNKDKNEKVEIEVISVMENNLIPWEYHIYTLSSLE